MTECDELFCENEAEWVFSGTACSKTNVCGDHALEFPNEQLTAI